jgi:hypothetical protein
MNQYFQFPACPGWPRSSNISTVCCQGTEADKLRNGRAVSVTDSDRSVTLLKEVINGYVATATIHVLSGMRMQHGLLDRDMKM